MDRYKSDEGAVQINPDDAAALGLLEGEPVRLVSAYGSDILRLQISSDLPHGIIFTSINAVNGSSLFPGNLPEVKAYAVKIEKSD
jgi:predicted molibdopterin-dependent oxidoreductase YjgC